MHILFVGDHLGYSGGAWHGCTTYFVNVLPQLRKVGHTVGACLLRAHHPAAQQLRDAGINVTFFDARPGSVYTIRRLASRAVRERVDVLHAVQRESSALGRILKPVLWSTAIAMHVVDSDPLPRVERLLNRYLPQPDAALCVSRAVCPTAIHEYRVKKERLRVLHNGIDIPSLLPSAPDIRERLRREWDVPAGGLVIASTSRFGPEKRLDTLIGMIPGVLAVVPNAVFVFAGAGQELARCRELAARLGVTHAARFLGHRSDVKDVLTASDVAVMLCLIEAFGYAAVEALALGIPVVAYEAAGLAEVIVHERTGLLAQPGDDDMFREYLIRIVSEYDLRRRLSGGAREDAQRFSVHTHVAALERIYNDLLSGRGIRPSNVRA